MENLTRESIQPWIPHEKAAPVTEREGDTLSIASNGTRTCVGGWQVNYVGVESDKAYRVTWDVEYEDIAQVEDMLECLAYMGSLDEDVSRRTDRGVTNWYYLLPEKLGVNTLRFSRILKAVKGVDRLTFRCTFRWSPKGKCVWQLPSVETVDMPESSKPVNIAVVTGPTGSRRRKFESIQDNIDFYAPLCERAAEKGAELIVTPEIALQYGLRGSNLDCAVPAPGPETDVFADIARKYETRILLGMVEQDGDAAYNSAVLIGPTGEIDGKYRKVHFAVGGEMDSGLLPGDSFPVFDTEIGRVGCNICMDTSAAESSRLVGLNGADFLLMPIMGDFRARFTENDTWDADRFRAIMQTRAMDNQLCMVVAVNQGEGSCIIDRAGNMLAWNDGEQEMILAEVTLDDGFHPTNKGCAREVTWMLRRPHLYGAFSDVENTGSLTDVTFQ